MTTKKQHLHVLVEASLFLALSIVLSYIKVVQLPFNGSLTLLSMLPISFVAIKHGTAWGLGTAFAYSWFQILQGGVFAWGLTPLMLVASLFLDYILAFTVLGLAGLFRRRSILGILGGVLLACLLRFLMHFISGFVLWAELDMFELFGKSFVNRPVLYSLAYNGVYMLPETVFTVIGAAVLLRLPSMRRLLSPEKS